MKITMVIVLYKQAIGSCKTFQTLMKSLTSIKENHINVEVILYDNSPEKQEFNQQQEFNYKIDYVHDNRNLGIATAYNFAFKAASANGSDWLLLLDHDTELTEEYVKEFVKLDSLDHNIAAVVPLINSNQKMISPVFSDAIRPLQGPMPSIGLQMTPVMAINSGSLIRIAFLNEIGGFNEQFPLDYLDHWLFFEIYSRNYKVWVLDKSLEHELSVMDYKNVSINRYRSILDAEINFYKNYKKHLLPAYKSQLVKRLIKQLILVKNKKIAAYTFHRLFSM